MALNPGSCSRPKHVGSSFSLVILFGRESRDGSILIYTAPFIDQAAEINLINIQNMRLTGSQQVLYSILACMKCSKSRRRGAYDAPPDPLVVRGFLPSAIIIVYMYMQPGFPLESKNRTCVRPDIKFWTYQIPSSDHTGHIYYYLAE